MADLHLVSLDPAFEGLVWPSEIYGIEAAGRPWIRLRPGLEVEDLRRAAFVATGGNRTGSDEGAAAAWEVMLGGGPTDERMPASATVGVHRSLQARS